MFKFIKIRNEKIKILNYLTIIFAFFVTFVNIKTVSAYTITFWQSSGKDIRATCNTNANGNITASCVNSVNSLCQFWSTTPYDGYKGYTYSACGAWCVDCDLEQQSGIKCSLGSYVFKSDTSLYCVSGSSNDINENKYFNYCYVCKDNSNIMKWSADGTDPDEKCSSGYKIDSSISQSNCKSKLSYCYVCEGDETLYEWRTDGTADTSCTSGYKKTELSEADCKYVEPKKACYVCKNNETMFEWKTDGAADASCSLGYDKTEFTESECKYVEPEKACYVCESDETLYEWRTDGTADNSCSSGYNKTELSETDCRYVEPEKACYVCESDETLYEWRTDGTANTSCPLGYYKTQFTESECKYVPEEIEENVETGDVFIVIAWVIGFSVLGYSIYFFRGNKNNI